MWKVISLSSVWLLFLLSLARSALAQQPISEGSASNDAPSGEPIVVAPTAVSTPVEYPESADGVSVVALTLTISEDGRVVSAEVLSGSEPFAAAAVESTANWKFVPATANGVPVTSRIRFQVVFEPPEPKGTRAEQSLETDSSVDDSEVSGVGDGSDATIGPKASPPIEEVTVIGAPTENKSELSAEEVRTLPGAFGDAFRAIEILPGVLPLASGVPYFYIRGAPPANAGFLFDDVPIPALFHVLAGPAVVHPSSVAAVELYPGAYPARLGGVTGGVVAGVAAEPSTTPRAELSLRTVDVGGLVEAPFAQGKGSVLLSGRYSYTGWLLSQLTTDVKLSYWDYQARVGYDLSPIDRLEVLWFGASDYLADRPPVMGTVPGVVPGQAPFETGYPLVAPP